MRARILLPVTMMMTCCGAHTPASADTHIFVDCDNGDDRTTGLSAAQPLRTLVAARAAIHRERRQLHQPHDPAPKSFAPATVTLTGTCYAWQQQRGVQDFTLVLDSALDSDTSWEAAADADGSPGTAATAYSGGLPISASFDPAPALLAQLQPAVRGRVRAASLQNVSDLGRFRARPFTGGDACIRADFFEPAGAELIWAGGGAAAESMQVARFPDATEPPVPENFVRIRSVTAGANSSADITVSVEVTSARCQQWRSQIATNGPELWGHGLWEYNWADSHRRIRSVECAAARGLSAATTCTATLTLEKSDLSERDIAPAPASTDGSAAEGGHIYVYNAMYELSQPGEYIIDHARAMLYFMPPVAAADQKGLELTLPMELVRVTGPARSVSFRGLRWRGARGAAIGIENSTNVTVVGGSISDAGMMGLNVTGGYGCGISGAEITRTGDGGVVLNGGDRTTLLPSNHFVRGCNIHHFNRWLMMYAPGVLMAGVGQSVVQTSIHHAPHLAVFVQGNMHALNDTTIFDVVQQCSDCGAYYFGRDWSYRGMVISHCNFTLDGPMWPKPNRTSGGRGQSVGAKAIYADDFSSSVAVLDSHFTLGPKMWSTFYINGGRSHRFERNVVRSIGAASSHIVTVTDYSAGCFSPNETHPETSALPAALPYVFLQRVPYNSSAAWTTAFPELATILADSPCTAAQNVIKDNVYCFQGGNLTDPPRLAFTIGQGTTGSNNTWSDAVCGPSPPVPSPSPPNPPSPDPTPTGPMANVSYDATAAALTFTAPSLRGARDSMPTGNGYQAGNVWTTAANNKSGLPGSLAFYVARGEAYDGYHAKYKLGLIRVTTVPDMITGCSTFRQTLDLRRSEVRVHTAGCPHAKEASATFSLRLFVDANNNATHVDFNSSERITASVGLELWRTDRNITFATTPLNDRVYAEGHRYGLCQRNGATCNAAFHGAEGAFDYTADTVTPDSAGVMWWYRNEVSVYNGTLTQQGLGGYEGEDPLLHLMAGAYVSGVGFRPTSDRTLMSQPGTSFRFSVATHVGQTALSSDFSHQLLQAAKAVSSQDFNQLLAAHRGYWTEFWQRSYVNLETPKGDSIGAQLTTDIALTRYMDACAGTMMFFCLSAIQLARLFAHPTPCCAGRQRYPIDNDGFMYTWPGRDEIYLSDTVRQISLSFLVIPSLSLRFHGSNRGPLPAVGQ
jgi:hypothetical protein